MPHRTSNWPLAALILAIIVMIAVQSYFAHRKVDELLEIGDYRSSGYDVAYDYTDSYAFWWECGDDRMIVICENFPHPGYYSDYGVRFQPAVD